MKPRISVVLNPHARRTRHAFEERAARLRRILGWQGAVHATRTLDELRDAVRRIMVEPPEVLVTDGGDGTLHWVLNEALGYVGDARDLPALMPTNGGTIDFVARKSGLRGHAETLVRRLLREVAGGRSPAMLELDTLDLTGTRRVGSRTEPFHRLGFALAAGGIGQRFFSKYYAERELGAGAIVLVVAKAVASRLAGQLGLPLGPASLDYGAQVFRPTAARVVIDGREVPGRSHGAIHAGAIDVSLGGVFRVFPLASEDGALHFQAGEIVPAEMIRALPSLARGRSIPSQRLIEAAGREMRIEALGEELLGPIVDGEPFDGLSELVVRRGPRIRVPRLS